jgi:hypothetical protein
MTEDSICDRPPQYICFLVSQYVLKTNFGPQITSKTSTLMTTDCSLFCRLFSSTRIGSYSRIGTSQAGKTSEPSVTKLLQRRQRLHTDILKIEIFFFQTSFRRKYNHGRRLGFDPSYLYASARRPCRALSKRLVRPLQSRSISPKN